MLILARKQGQVVKIGNDITIKVLEVRGDTVRLGIDAPRSLAVHRLEVYEEIVLENRKASSSQVSLENLKSLRSKSE